MSDSARPSILATAEDNNPANLSMALNEEKHPIESIISESKRLLKSGLYKKAFNLIENHKNDLQNATPSASIKVHRRMVICLTRICDRYLSKGDVQRVDHFVRLMNKSFEYLEGWHGLLCNYISKTNPNYMQMQKLLDEVSDYDDGFEFANPMRAKFRKETMNMNTNASYMSTMESTKPSSFMTKLKQSTFIGRSKAGGAYLEDTNTGVTDGSRLLTENAAQAAPQGQSHTHVEKEINPTFHLDEFIKYFLSNLLNWVTFYKRVAKKYDVAYRFLNIGYRISKILDVCYDADTLQVVAKARLALGAFFLEFGRHQEALLVFESAINVLHTEVSVRLNKDKQVKQTLKSVFKFKTTIRLLILTFVNISICFEQQENYPRVLESLKLGLWFANRFTAPEDEAYIILNTQYNNAMEKYDNYLRDLGEAERVIAEPQITAPPGETEQNEDKTTEHFGKINSYLYDKFDYEKLNVSQAIVFPAPLQGRRESTFKNRAEFLLEERNDSTEHKYSWTRGEQSLGRTMMHTEGFDSPSGMAWKHNSGIMTKSSIVKGRRKMNRSAKRLSSVGGEETRRPLTSDKYRQPVQTEKDALELDLDDADEQEFIEKLNRNIKDKTKSAKYRRNEGNFLDLDNYFEKVIEEKIQTKEEEMHVRPMGFKQIVRNYAVFDKNEQFDKVEFSFASRTLSNKARENLGDYTFASKNKFRTSKFAQVNEVKIEAQLLEARNEAEAKLANRNGVKGLLTAKAGQAKTVKFASQIDLDSKTSLAIINETPHTTKHTRNKPSFSNILMKHKDDLGLNAIHMSIKEKEKYGKKESKENQRRNEMNMLGFGGHKSPQNNMPTPSSRRGGFGTPHGGSNREVDTEQSKKMTTNANDMIQLLMESIEKTIENDVNIRKRIEDNKPLVEIKKASTRFLKVSDELAKSTVNISNKLDSGKKNWNLANVVKGMQGLKKKVMIKTTTQDF